MKIFSDFVFYLAVVTEVLYINYKSLSYLNVNVIDILLQIQLLVYILYYYLILY